MRDIKFRARNKITGKIYPAEDELCISSTGKGAMMYDCIYGDHDYLEELELLQFTGLYDKNGVEIYESDIVEYRGKRGVVFMRLGCWFVEFQRELGYYNHSVIVVGNIHEQESHT